MIECLRAYVAVTSIDKTCSDNVSRGQGVALRGATLAQSRKMDRHQTPPQRLIYSYSLFAPFLNTDSSGSSEEAMRLYFTSQATSVIAR